MGIESNSANRVVMNKSYVVVDGSQQCLILTGHSIWSEFVLLPEGGSVGGLCVEAKKPGSHGPFTVY